MSIEQIQNNEINIDEVVADINSLPKHITIAIAYLLQEAVDFLNNATPNYITKFAWVLDMAAEDLEADQFIQSINYFRQVDTRLQSKIKENLELLPDKILYEITYLLEKVSEKLEKVNSYTIAGDILEIADNMWYTVEIILEEEANTH